MPHQVPIPASPSTPAASPRTPIQVIVSTAGGSSARHTIVDSPIGGLLLTRDDRGLTGLFMDADRHAPWLEGSREDPAAFRDVADQLAAYFAGELTDFDLPLAPSGSSFQLTVWAALRTIPYGETRRYVDIARQIGKPSGSRAVGLANGRNPISIIVPCHRVIGADGSLTGYGGGLERKRTLLDLESSTLFPLG
jgi:methylated-DNA-[protein]-cysteine S-methyltransferase